MMMPPLVLSSSSIRRRTTRSCNGRNFIALPPSRQIVGGAFLRTLPARLLDQRLGAFKRRVLIALPLERRRGPGTAEALVRRKRPAPQDHPLAVAPVRFEELRLSRAESRDA